MQHNVLDLTVSLQTCSSSSRSPALRLEMDDEIDFAALAKINLDDELTPIAPASSPELSAKEGSRHEGLSPAGQHLSDTFGDPASLAGPSSGRGTSARSGKGNGSPMEAKSPGALGMNFIKSFTGVQKKITRGK